MLFANKVVIVTGAGSGIGAAVAVKLAKEGAKLSLADKNGNSLETVGETCKKFGENPLLLEVDLTVDDDAKKVVSETVERYGKIDILINNVGIILNTSIFDEDIIKKFDKTMSLNLRTAVLMTNLAARHLAETKGNIVNTSSVAARLPMSETQFAYCTSKAAIDHFTRCAALEMSRVGVRVNAVNPGPVKTNILTNAGMNVDVADFTWQECGKAAALGKICEPEEIADLILYLASDKAGSITGSTVLCDNGTSLTGKVL